jgi:hypothetical protein
MVPYTDAEVPAALAFNDRMLAGRAPTDFVLPVRPNPAVPTPAPPITRTHYLAIEAGGEARGGFLLMEQPAVLNGELVRAANYQAPVSEGILDNRFGMIGMHMIRYVLRRSPYSFVVGMGAADRPLPRLLAAGGWTLRPVPFLFRIVRTRRVLRELRLLQRRPWLRIGASVAAATGAGWLAVKALHARGMLSGRSTLRAEKVTAWGDWADTLWHRVRDLYSFAVVRDRASLECLYPLDDARYSAYVFRQGDEIAGWAVCAQTAMRDHAYFGDLRVATVLDAVSLPAAAPALASDLSRRLADWADVVITNQSHALWIGAFRGAGFAAAPSNYLLALSKPLANAIGDGIDRVHISRGDGDGRIHLL